jgi:hypothetical protein
VNIVLEFERVAGVNMCLSVYECTKRNQSKGSDEGEKSGKKDSVLEKRRRERVKGKKRMRDCTRPWRILKNLRPR